MRHLVPVLALALAVAACGGDDTAGNDPAENPTAQSNGREGPEGGDVVAAGGDTSTGGSSQAQATLVVGDVTHTFEGNQWTYCTIGGVFPVSVEFQREEVKWDGDWFQFIDRGDGGINFSAVFGGEEYSGTGSGEADEITANGFTFTGTLNRSGEVLDTVLEVTC